MSLCCCSCVGTTCCMYTAPAFSCKGARLQVKQPHALKQVQVWDCEMRGTAGGRCVPECRCVRCVTGQKVQLWARDNLNAFDCKKRAGDACRCILQAESGLVRVQHRVSCSGNHINWHKTHATATVRWRVACSADTQNHANRN